MYVLKVKLYHPGESGAYARNRTGDLILTKDALYQLSYVGNPIHHTRN